MRKGLVVAPCTFDADKGWPVFDDRFRVHEQMKKAFAAGERVIARFEPEGEARKRHREKWYFGYIVAQCIEHTGETAKERDTDLRALFLPPDCDTYSDMNDEQAAQYNLSCELYAAETIGVVVVGPHDAREWTV